MRLKLVIRLAIVPVFFLLLPLCLLAQNFSFNCTRDTVIAGCSPNPCFTLKAIVPDIHQSSATYKVNPIPAANAGCVPVYSNPAIPGTPTNLVDDDTYSTVIPIGFPFSFYGTVYNNLVISSNGVVSFDLSRANQEAHYGMFNAGGVLATAGGPPENLPSTLYDPAIIMGPYHDIDITIGSSPNRRIQYNTVGAAPNRKWVLSFYKIPLFNCNTSFENTHQIVLNEATGIIEVLIFSKQRCSSWNQGRAMVGIQNFARDQGLMPPGRRASDPSWGTVDMNESWRFVPSAGNSLFKYAELYDINGVPLPNAVNVVTLANGTKEIYFDNVCAPANAVTSYVVKSVYGKYDNPVVEIAGFDTIRVTRSAATDLNATASAISSACGAAGTGSITVQVPNGAGTGTYEYSLTSATGPWQPAATFSNLTAGAYTVYVRDQGGGCSSTVSVNVPGTGTIPVTFTTTNTSCPGAINGTITVNVNATPTTEYRINSGPWVSNNVFTGIPAGTHFVDVRDLASGCVANGQAATVGSGTTTITGSAIGTPTSCAGLDNGVITVTGNGAGPFDYSLNGGTNWQTSNIFNGLAAGNYNVLIRAGGVCTSAPIAVQINAGSGLVPVLTASGTTCAGISNGSISITMPAGTIAPYTIVRDGNTSTSSNTTVLLTGIAAGDHSITVTDASGCSTESPITVNVPAGTGFTASFTANPTSCSGINDGSLTITPQAPGTAPFSYLLNPGAIAQTNAVFNGLSPGTYSVLVTDANGCQFTVNNIVVNQGAGLVANLTSSPASCTGINNGSITVTTNGTAPFSFTLDGTVVQTSNTASTTFNNLAPGTHTVTVTDDNGCNTSTAVSITITTGSGFTASNTVTPVSCAGGSDGTIVVIIGAAGTAPYNFILNGSTTQTGAAGTTFTGLTAGTAYNVLVRDAVGCTFTLANISIQEPLPLTATSNVQAARCNGADNGSISVAASGGTAPYEYSLDNTTYQTTAVFTNIAVGNYTVYIRDAKSCVIQMNNLSITEPPVLTASIASTGNASCDGGDDGNITITASGGTAPYQYSLDGISFIASSVLQAGPGDHAVTIRDANGCSFLVPGGATVGLANNLTLTPMTDPAAECEGTGVQLQVITNATAFEWTPSAGLNNSSVINPLASPSLTTAYTVTATLGRCSTTDEVTVSVLPAPIANAGNGGTICYGQNFQLQGSGGVSYSWTPTADLSDPGIANPTVINPFITNTYLLSVTDANNCNSLVPAQVEVIVTPPIRITVSPIDTVVYAGTQFHLLASSVATGYTWSPAIGLDNPSVSNPTVTAPLEGEQLTYQVVGTTSSGCSGEAYVTIRVYKGPDIYMANAFSPNNDGKNDEFIPFPVGIKKLNYFRVYNRWGQLLFSTSTLHAGWNGRLAGIEQANGVYVWQVQGIMENGKLITKQGTVTLIR